MNKFPTKFNYGQEFFRLAETPVLDVEGYFRVIKTIRPLLKDVAFENSTPAFYLNYIRDDQLDNYGSLRMSYYSIDIKKTLEVINKFILDNSNKVISFSPKQHQKPDLVQEMSSVKKEDIKFPIFLNTNTQIVLDLLESYGALPLQKLVLEYRYFYLPLRVPPEVIFEPIFSKHSIFLKELKTESLDKQYWEDLVNFFDKRDFGLHFLVNMVVPKHESPYDPRYFESNWYLR